MSNLSTEETVTKPTVWEKIVASIQSAPEVTLSLFTSFPKNLVESAKELKNLHSLTGIAMLLALSVALNAFSIQLTPSIKIGIGYLVTALLGMLYGPVAGGLAAGAGDIIKFMIKPTGAFFPGYTLNAILGGVIYGFFFYKHKTSVGRCAASKLIINIFLNAMLGTYWNSILLGKGFSVLFPARLTLNLTKLLPEIILLYIVTKAALQVVKRVGGHFSSRSADAKK